MHPEPNAWLRLRQAFSLFRCPPDELDPARRSELERVVSRQVAIEEAILASPQARGIAVPAGRLEASFAEIAARYTSELEFANDMARHGMTRASLREELGRDLRVERVLESLATCAPVISRVEAEIFYWLHHDRFRQEERRTLRHILVTLDDELRGSDRLGVAIRMEAIRAQCIAAPDRFAALALRHSECPTALQGGTLGEVKRGQLFPSLEQAAFALRKGEISAIVESPMGLHLIVCEHIAAASRKPFAEVRERIQTLMGEARLRNQQSAWIKSLMAGKPEETVRLSA